MDTPVYIFSPLQLKVKKQKSLSESMMWKDRSDLFLYE